MALINTRRGWLAACLLLSSALCQAADLVSEARYASITVGNSVSTISQIGSYNQTRVDQSGAAQRLTQIQSGNRNQATLNQSGVNNAITAQQTGSSNTTEVSQSGTHNQTGVVQNGTGNAASVVQSGAYNQAFVGQYGQANQASVNQAGFGGTISVTAVRQQHDRHRDAEVMPMMDFSQLAVSIDLQRDHGTVMIRPHIENPCPTVTSVLEWPCSRSAPVASRASISKVTFKSGVPANSVRLTMPAGATCLVHLEVFQNDTMLKAVDASCGTATEWTAPVLPMPFARIAPRRPSESRPPLPSNPLPVAFPRPVPVAAPA